MADAELTVGVEVALRPDENTARWLESLGWIRPGAPSQEVVETEEDDEYDPRPLGMLGDLDMVELVPEARPLRTGRAMTGAEAMRYRAARLRQDLMSEVSSPERVDEMLRSLDIDPSALPDPDCDC